MCRRKRKEFQCSSASRKFLNSSTGLRGGTGIAFQCSSASRKFLNHKPIPDRRPASHMFQCSSASRKFLNIEATRRVRAGLYVSVLFSEPKIPQSILNALRMRCILCFSALQRAENSSIRRDWATMTSSDRVSVLFSEPKIPQCRPSHLRPSIFPTAMITLRHS